MKYSPTIIAIAAMTIDGKIARNANHPSDWTSSEDKASLRTLIVTTDVIVIGHTTYLLHESRLKKRPCIVFTRSIVDREQTTETLSLYNPGGPTPINEVLQPYGSVALLGGAQVYSYFLEHGLIDEIYLTIEPVIFGEGIDFFGSNNLTDARFALVSDQRLNSSGTVLLHYKK